MKGMDERCSSTPSSLPSLTLLTPLACCCCGQRAATSVRGRRRCPRPCLLPSRGCASGLSAETMLEGLLTKSPEEESGRDGGVVRLCVVWRTM